MVFNAKSKSADKSKVRTQTNPLGERLVKLGLDRGDATEAVQRLTSERIAEDIEHVEFEAKAGRVKSSKAGMLAAMLKASEPWSRPQGFVSSMDRDRKQKAAADSEARKRKEAVEREVREREAEELRLQAFNEFMAGLTDKEQAEFDERAKGVFYLGERYCKAIKDGDSEKISSARQAALYATWSADQRSQPKASEDPREVQKSAAIPGWLFFL